METHSIIPPSSAGIWGKPGGCTGWVMMSQLYPQPDDPTGPAAEGTASHEIAAQLVKRRMRSGIGPVLEVGETASNGIVVTDEIREGAELYADDIITELDARLTKGGIRHACEEKIKIPRVHELSEGTPDMWLYDPNTRELILWDYKFGYVIVEAFENWQGINYLAGLLELLGIDGFEEQRLTVRLRIVQPRAPHREGPIREWAFTASDIRAQINILASNAVKALGPDAELKTGSHCRFCYPRFACPVALKAGLGLYEMAAAPVPVDLKPEDLGLLLSIVTRAMEQMKSLKSAYSEQVKALQKGGTVVPGWALEPSKGNLTWIKPPGEVFKLGELFEKDLRQKKPITPLQAIKLGIDEAVIKPYIDRKDNGLALVPDNGNKARQIFGGSKK